MTKYIIIFFIYNLEESKKKKLSGNFFSGGIRTKGLSHLSRLWSAPPFFYMYNKSCLSYTRIAPGNKATHFHPLEFIFK